MNTDLVEGYPASVNVFGPDSALTQLKLQLATAERVLGWIYLVDEEFCSELLQKLSPTSVMLAIADHRQKRTVARLMGKFPNFRARTWSWNRTQHDKTLIFPDVAVTWLLTHNLTRGAWTLSSNRAGRITSPALTKRLTTEFQTEYNRARAVLPA